jgi:nucleoid-associated protein YgaU
MERGIKVVVATCILAAGIAAALQFRHPSRRAHPPKPASPDNLVLRHANGSKVAQSPALDRLTAQIESSAASPRPVERSDQSARAPEPVAPSQPPPPPKLARSYPPVPDQMAPGDPATRQDDLGTGRTAGATRTHKIVDGDTLTGLAERYLGSADRYLEIYEANRDLLPSPEVLPIGAKLRIPPREEPAPASPGPPQESLVPVAPIMPAPDSS